MNFTNPSLSSILRNKFCLLTHTIDSPLRISYNSWISQILSCSVWHVITISFSLFSYFPRNFRHLTPFPDAWRVTREERISSYYIHTTFTAVQNRLPFSYYVFFHSSFAWKVDIYDLASKRKPKIFKVLWPWLWSFELVKP